ncbi:hypothetical protein CJ030_MR8G005347 [Morella rubra]|uniref:Uncharacterized protein n=1 Tax=Morella rubra TaxID=262757 RepID=A0A6A1UNI0_9ROSI|nr:hypothetical protein CJ030_MR8G005347 [Morella rubra]
MGSCLSSSSTKTSEKGEKEEVTSEAEVVEEITESSIRSKLEPVKQLEADAGTKKMVRFKLQEGENVDKGNRGESRSGVVRVRMVVTLKELKQILDSEENTKYSSMEQLVSAMKLRGRRICEVRTSDAGVNSPWRPALESIPEDH